ncbi:MAG TPA: paraquat-inducible protein A [Usitatibacter sp.]|nr:paraquat-inducible protein A [Usitatibacter sp.]
MTPTASRHDLYLCDVCRMLNRHGDDEARGTCARCGAALHGRKPNSLSRTWAFLIAAAILYVPANLLPVLHTGTVFEYQTDTIMSGVIHLWTTRSYGLALIVFVASIVVPLAKIVSLAYLAWMAQRGSRHAPQRRAWIYRLTHSIGRWSMVDIYVGAVLVALVHLGPLASVEPGPAAIAFGAVVILTMLASQSFDPRLTWDCIDGGARTNKARSPDPHPRSPFLRS